MRFVVKVMVLNLLLRVILFLCSQSKSDVCIFGTNLNLFLVQIGLYQRVSPIQFQVFINSISRHSCEKEGVRCGNLRVSSLLIAGEGRLLAIFSIRWDGLQMNVRWLDWESVLPSLRSWVSIRERCRLSPQIRSESLPQAEKFNPPSVHFISHGKMEWVMNWQTEALSAVMVFLLWSNEGAGSFDHEMVK